MFISRREKKNDKEMAARICVGADRGNGLVYGKSADYHCKGSIDTESYREERSNQCNDC